MKTASNYIAHSKHKDRIKGVDTNASVFSSADAQAIFEMEGRIVVPKSTHSSQILFECATCRTVAVQLVNELDEVFNFLVD